MTYKKFDDLAQTADLKAYYTNQPLSAVIVRPENVSQIRWTAMIRFWTFHNN